MTCIAHIVMLAESAAADAAETAAPTVRSVPTYDILVWLGVLLGLVLIGYLVAIHMRSRIDEAPTGPLKATFTLDELRDLHAGGHLTDAEYERARARMLEESGHTAAPSQPEVGKSLGTEHPARDLGPELLADPNSATPPPLEAGDSPDDLTDGESHNGGEGESDRRID